MITIDEAIKELTTYGAIVEAHPRDKIDDAIQLGIEALKRVKEARKKVYFTSRSLLPGETKD